MSGTTRLRNVVRSFQKATPMRLTGSTLENGAHRHHHHHQRKKDRQLWNNLLWCLEPWAFTLKLYYFEVLIIDNTLRSDGAKWNHAVLLYKSRSEPSSTGAFSIRSPQSTGQVQIQKFNPSRRSRGINSVGAELTTRKQVNTRRRHLWNNVICVSVKFPTIWFAIVFVDARRVESSTAHLRGMVADHSVVCLSSGISLNISSTGSWNPIWSIRSASSRTQNWISLWGIKNKTRKKNTNTKYVYHVTANVCIQYINDMHTTKQEKKRPRSSQSGIFVPNQIPTLSY